MCALLSDASSRPTPSPASDRAVGSCKHARDETSDGPSNYSAERILLLDYQIDPAEVHGSRIRVTVEWQGIQSTGEVVGGELTQNRQRAVAEATLNAVTKAVAAAQVGGRQLVPLELDGIDKVQIGEYGYTVVAIYARSGRETRHLAGAVAIDPIRPELAVIFAALQAINRWLREYAGTARPSP